MNDLPKITIYTDGACASQGPRAKCGGWANILIWHKSETEALETVRSGRIFPSTNSRMEAYALLDALQSLRRPCQVEFYSDSIQLVEGVNTWLKRWVANGWKKYTHKPVANQDLWKKIADLRKVHQINGNWVQAHVGAYFKDRTRHHDYNDRCDILAVNEAIAMQKELELT